MSINKKRVADFSIAATLALGFAALIMLLLFAMAVFRESTRSYQLTRTGLTKTADLTLIHQRKSYNRGWRTEYWSLDGKRVSDQDMYAGQSYVLHDPTTYRLIRWHWSHRLMAFDVGDAYWYLVRSAGADKVFFVGYEKNRGIVGYLGANGYGTSQPTTSEQITIPTGDFYLVGEQNRIVNRSRVNNCPSVLLATPEGILKVDFRDREVSSFSNISDARQITPAGPNGDFAVRAGDQIHVLDNEGNKLASLPDVSGGAADKVTIYPEFEDQIAVCVSNRQIKLHEEYYWYKKDQNSVIANELIRNESFDATNGSEIGWIGYAANAVSSPLVVFFQPTLPFILATCLLPSLLALVTWRIENSFNNKLAWATFAFVLGLPGFLGYWFHRNRKATLLSCLKCSALIPRLGSECESCQEPLSLPSRIGTEIFA